MAELLMECEEEELEPWQQRIKEVEDDDDEEDEDDDEPIFVREISGAKVTNTSNAPGTQQSSFSRVENGTPNRGSVAAAASFQSPVNHYKAPPSNTGAQPIPSMYQPATRPVASSAVVQPQQRPVCPPEPIKRPLPAHQPPRANTPMLHPVCRSVTIASNSQPACKNVTLSAMAQPTLRPVATITAQPVILNQGYIVNSPQVSANNSPNVMYALRPTTALTQYQSVQAVTATGNSTQLVRPLQPSTQMHPVSTPSRTLPAIIQRPLVTQNSLLTVQSPLLLNAHKPQQGIHGQSLPGAGRNENASVEKRPAPIEITSVSPKKPKTIENGPEIRLVSSLSSKPTTPSHSSVVNDNVGTTSGATPQKNGAPFPRACPKCNIHFNLLEPLKRHMTYCCPDKMHNFLLGIAEAEVTSSQTSAEDLEKGKLIMLVSDFYYGKHLGDVNLAQQEQKTYTTFRCFSCQKLLKNNIRFMNHMKHHLELEKQSTESWENHTTCHHCYRQFPTPFQLQCHIESSHTLYESSICRICELSFNSEQILLQHMKDNHKPGEMPYVCQVCNYRSSSFLDVDSHFRIVHENTKSLLCPFCLKVIKCGTPYMQHYMKHQNKGIYRCAKCRLQFLSCKEKMDHKTQHHRTFKKPRQLEGLPPGTKVTIRASVGNLNTAPCTTTSVCTSPPTTPVQTSSKSKIANTKVNQTPGSKSNVQHAKSKPPPQKKPAANTTTPSSTTTKRIKTINSALRNLGTVSGLHKCIECQMDVEDFENHFHTYVHCSKCKFSTSCNKAYMNHVISFHGRNSHKRAKLLKKGRKDRRRVTLVCLNCDFLTDVFGIDDMAKHLGERPSHSCQVVMESVSIYSSTLEGVISKSRYDPSVGLKQIYYKKESGMLGSGIKSNSTEEQYEAVKNEEESNIDDSEKPKEVQKDASLSNRQMNSEVPDSGKSNTDNCIKTEAATKAELFDKVTNNCIAIEEQLSLNKEELGQTPDVSAFTEDEEKLIIEPLEETGDHNDFHFVGDDGVSFEQFLRRRDEPESVGSDISDQSSVHLEPLTPSEVLENEATEILQKGTVPTSQQKCATREQAKDSKDAGAESAVVAADATEEDDGGRSA